tara:strand:- start:1472 stop:2746 length:1275 start_codon:yes stop_codon:yes gene_type:complete
MSKISKVRAIQVFDSRGVPTISCKVSLDDGSSALAMVPSGASTGSKEAFELRDGNKAYHGKGVLNAVSNVNEKLSPIVIGKDPSDQNEIDKALIEFDGTSDKSVVGANAILAVSLATAKVASKIQRIPLYKHFSNIYKNITGDLINTAMPMPMFNILNGGEHSNNNIDIQEFMIIPSGAKNFEEVMQWSVEIYHNLKKILSSNNHSIAVGDEGGFAPNLKSNEEAIQLIIEAIKNSNLELKKDINIALDCAASEFFDGSNYFMTGENKKFTSAELVNYLEGLVEKYPITSIEDGMDENDNDGWKLLTSQLGNKCQLVGDDLFVTNKEILKEGVQENIANSILIKLNQIGSLSETIETIHLAKKSNYKSIISHRSGETEDTTIADLAVGLGIGQIKTGAPSRSDRIAKYNRLLWIEKESSDILLK